MTLWRLLRLVVLVGAMATVACQFSGLDAPIRRTENIAFGRPTAWQPLPCWFEVRARHAISCAQLIVPEDWAAADDRQLHLPVVIFHTALGRDSAEPVVYLNGGPGDRSGIRTDLEIERWRHFLDVEPWTRAHDLIVIAQRGTTWTDSDLSCPGLSDPTITINIGATPGASVDWRQRLGDAVTACRQRLVAQGHALGAYNSTQSARDLAALRLLLGLDAWSLYGVSYGTRFALTLMRDHPEGIRSAILDSPYPPQVSNRGDAAGFQQALDQVVGACQTDRLCRAYYPDLRSDLAGIVADLAQTPLHLPVSRRDGTGTTYLAVDDAEFLDALFSFLRDRDRIEYIPGLIEEIKERPGTFAARYQDVLFREGDADSAEGAFFSIFCNDDPAVVDAGNRATEADRYPLLRNWLLARSGTVPCDLWPVTAIDPRDKQPVVSDIPTLILVGALDPTTPPAYAYSTAGTLGRAHVFVFRGVSHGVLAADSCASEVVEKFLAQPEIRPDINCPGATPEFSPSISERGAALLGEGRIAQAEALLRKLLAMQEQTFGAGHRNIAITASELGRVHMEQDRDEDAAALFKRALAINSKLRGRYDLNTAASAFYLATAYQKQGQYQKAEPLYRRALRIEEVRYGPNHPDVAITLQAYAGMLRALGRDAEAGELEARAAAIGRG